MQITIRYHDDTALTIEEVVKQATNAYGKAARVDVVPDSNKPHDMIYFAVQCMITHQQLGLLYDDKLGYQESIQKIRNETLYKLEEILSQVIIDNESRVV